MRRGRPSGDLLREREAKLAEAFGAWCGRRSLTQADLARLIRAALGCTDSTAFSHARATLRAWAARLDDLPPHVRIAIAKARAVRDVLRSEEMARAA